MSDAVNHPAHYQGAYGVEYENVIRCTSCGHEECNPCSNDCMYGNAKYKWKYCPNCGARVVER